MYLFHYNAFQLGDGVGGQVCEGAFGGGGGGGGGGCEGDSCRGAHVEQRRCVEGLGEGKNLLQVVGEHEDGHVPVHVLHVAQQL